MIVQREVVVLPKSVTEKRIIDNLKIIKLDDEDMETLNNLYKTKGKRFIKVSCSLLFSRDSKLT